MFDDVLNVRRQLVGVPRASVQAALADPAKYLQCTCCEVSALSVPAARLVIKLRWGV